ncbi:type IX secretion system sortase PorU [Psychroserpens sp.]|uniref:type IX secretion system sortase PorU n=1 Tax=Psychroserpens sp. TaxID=2020870 RepID=UPI003858844F
MKKLLFISFIVCNVFAFAQQKQFSIQWDGTTTLETSSFQIELPAFNKENFSYSMTEGLYFVSQWDINSPLSENSLELTNVLYETISRDELKGLSVELIPNEINVKLSNSIDRNNISGFLKISPIINDNGIFKRITSFKIEYSSSSNRNTLSSQEIVNSVLSSGSWRRFYVERSGVFKISKSFLEDIGVDTDVDPRTIKIYGNGGKMLPMPNDEFYPLDLTENAVKFVGENDGDFNNGDYILFYAEGPTGNTEEVLINTNINPYSSRSYYYVTYGGSFGKRIETVVQPTESADFTIDTFQDYGFYEVDEFNIAKLGRRWFGDRFDIENQKSYEFNFPNIVTTEPAKLKVYVGAVSEVLTSFQIELNGVNVTTVSPVGLTDGILATGAFYVGDVQLSSSEVNVGIEYNNFGNPSSLGYLDYVSLEATRELAYTGGQLLFKNDIVETTDGIVEYEMSSASNVEEIWDISNKYNVTSIPNSNQESDFSFKAASGTLKHYIAFNSQSAFQPIRDANSFVDNQNIKGTIFQNVQGEFEDIDYIIVTPGNMYSQANRLAEINRQQYDLNVKVLTLDQIYKEFSSGNQDIGGIRNMIRYVYHNASAPDKRLKYVCFFGDASFDYKDRISNNTNIVPTWFSYNSFSLVNSFVSDDFYAMMDDNEGDVEDVSNKADIAVGRILASTPQQAEELVDKIQEYYSEASFGSWRNNILMISDDVDIGSFEGDLQQTTDDIANIITQEKPFLNAVKIHSDAFLQESSSAGERYPQVNKEIRDAIDVGALVVNYFGHGGEDGLASERIFDKNDSQEVANVCKYNLFVTVTCEYTKFDDPLRQTAGEFTYWNTKGGAIGLITTTRQIFVSLGQAFNVVIEPYLFAFGSNETLSIAEALRQSKNDPAISSNIQKSLVWFIGDPAMKLAFAKPDVRLTHINDVPIGGNTDVLQALSKVKFSGEVVNESGNLLSDYNGTLTATVFDKEIDRQTLNNDNQTNGGQPVIMNFKTLGEVIFKGQATVANGLFEFEFVVPRDIGIPVAQGKVNFYSMRKLPLENRSGSSFDIQIGGINANAAEDNTGPLIDLFMNDENFVSGGITNEQPALVARLQDENGINTASGIGHDIVAILDGDETNPFVLNDYYQANIDDYQNGKVNYPFRDLAPGRHTLSFKAWDVYNNSSKTEIEFVVTDKDQELVIDNVLNYPNPFVDYTEFWFNHNSPDVLDVSVQIFTVSGKLVRTLNGQTNGGSKVTSSLSKDIVWDGRDDFGDKIGKGVYIYKLKVRSNRLNKQVEKIEKLVIL